MKAKLWARLNAFPICCTYKRRTCKKIHKLKLEGHWPSCVKVGGARASAAPPLPAPLYCTVLNAVGLQLLPTCLRRTISKKLQSFNPVTSINCCKKSKYDLAKITILILADFDKKSWFSISILRLSHYDVASCQTSASLPTTLHQFLLPQNNMTSSLQSQDLEAKTIPDFHTAHLADGDGHPGVIHL